MDVEIGLTEFLDGVRKQFNLDDKTSYAKVLSYIKKEIEFRESIAKRAREKLEALAKLFNQDIDRLTDSLAPGTLEDFSVSLDLPASCPLSEMSQVSSLKLQNIFLVDIRADCGQMIMTLRINAKKLETLRGFIVGGKP